MTDPTPDGALVAWLTAAAVDQQPVFDRPAGGGRPGHHSDPTDEGHPMAWTNDAVCVGVDQDVFFPAELGAYQASRKISPEVMAVARQYCSVCPVRAACLDHALRREKVGIWADTDPYTRLRLRRSLAIPDPDSYDDPAAPPPLWELDADGRSARDFAAAAGVSTRTVFRHRSRRSAPST